MNTVSQYRIRKLILCLVMAAAVACVLIPQMPAFAADNASYTTNSYNVDIRLKTDNTAEIKEAITINAADYIHGIYRYIPLHQRVTYRNESGKALRTDTYPLKVSDVSVDKYSFDTYKKGGNAVIQIGDSDQYVSGKKTYNIYYHVKMYKDRIKDYDSFYYNVLPYDWDTSIASSTITVHMPKSVKAGNISVIAGQENSTDDSSKISWDLNGNTITVKTKSALPQGDGITVGVMLPEGYFSEASSTSWMHYAQYGLGIILILLLIYLLMKFGRDPKRIQTVEFEAPDGITPAEVGYIIDGIADKEDIVSLIFYWANKGYIKIDKLDDTKDSDFRLTKLRELPEEAKTYELTFFRALFPGTCSAVLLSQLDEGVAPAMEAARDQLKGEFEKRKNRIFTRSGSISRIACVLIAMIGVMFPGLMMWIMYGSIFYFAIFAAAAVLLVPSYVISFITCDRKDVGQREKLFPNIIAVLLLIAVMAVCFFGMRRLESDTIAGVITAVLAAAGFVTTRYMRRRTKRGADVFARVLGFKQFIQTAEIDKLNMMVEDDPDYFYSVLPYAYVMGLSKKWAQKFEKIDVRKPSWYGGYGSSGDLFDTMMFLMIMNNFSRNFSSSAAAAAAPDISSDFGGGGSFGGGGFSGGGGFGGGGGGAW